MTVSSRGWKAGSLEGRRQVPACSAAWTSLLGPGCVLLQPHGVEWPEGSGRAEQPGQDPFGGQCPPTQGSRSRQWPRSQASASPLRAELRRDGRNSVCSACRFTRGAGRSGPGRAVGSGSWGVAARLPRAAAPCGEAACPVPPSSGAGQPACCGSDSSTDSARRWEAVPPAWVLGSASGSTSPGRLGSSGGGRGLPRLWPPPPGPVCASASLVPCALSPAPGD